jgi:ribosomal protein S18 acetylase RimI-like enzyme
VKVALRVASREDIDDVLALWLAAEAEPSHTDDTAGLSQLIATDRSALLVAEVDGEIVASVIAGWDGWRGSIYRLVVHPAYRRRGLARRLLTEAEHRLADLGARRLQAIVVESDEAATGFWRTSGWLQQTERLRFVHG